MAYLGAFTFVLHSHLPYCRRAGRWPHGEEWIHEAAAETYIPLLDALYDLLADGVRPRVTIGITPILTEQLADKDIADHFEEYLLEKIAAAEKDIVRLEAIQVGADAAAAQAAADEVEAERVADLDSPVAERVSEALDEPAALASAATDPDELPDDIDELEAADGLDRRGDAEELNELDELDTTDEEEEAEQPQPDPHRLYLARWYHDWYSGILRSFTQRYGRDIVGAFRRLQDEGVVELITSMATHCYTPLVARDSTIYAQLATGIASYQKHFGRKPRAMWLPECAYRPAFYQGEGDFRKPGVEEFLQAQGISCFFSETHLVEGGEPVGKARDEVVGPYGAIRRRYVPPPTEYLEPSNRTTYQPYYVYQSDVAVIGRNNRTGSQVWSGAMGYPGDADYREFHQKDSFNGMQYWRVTGPDADLGQKDYYHPDWAENKVYSHAKHFVSLCEELVAQYHNETGKYGLIASNYDTELFGHWWFEGVMWLREVLRGLAQSEVVELTTASDFLEAHPPEVSLALPEGSWGSGGTHFTWSNPDTDWLWPLTHEAERTMESLVARFPNATGDLELVLNQAARELVLLESSDWPFLVSTGQAREYSESRFAEHLARFNRLAAVLDGVTTAGDNGRALHEGRELAQQYFELDNPFPFINYRLFAEREGRVG